MRSLRPCVTALLALTLLTAIIGVPLPRWVKGKDKSVPFPCMNSPCGCTDAESCWKKCCCHTPREKLAWAKEHNVTPPDYVMAAAEKETAENAPACCCQKKKPKPSSVATSSGSCCSSKSVSTPSVTAENAENAAEIRVDVVILEDFNRCQGNASIWLVLSQAMIADDAAQVELPLPQVTWQSPPLSLPAFSPVYAIDTPPPRRV